MEVSSFFLNFRSRMGYCLVTVQRAKACMSQACTGAFVQQTLSYMKHKSRTVKSNMISSILSKRGIFRPATRLRHVALKCRAGFAFISRGDRFGGGFCWYAGRKGLCLFCQYMLTFPSCFICSDSVSCSSLPRITLACAGHACGWHKGSEKENTNTPPCYSP